MSKFLRTMTALSKRPSDFARPEAPERLEPTEPLTSTPADSDTVPVSNTVPNNGTVPQSGTVFSHTPPRPRVRIFKATRVEHGHSIGEHLIYEVLWRYAKGDDTARTIQIGYDRLASLGNVNWKTAKSCLRSLEEKLAIETIGAENCNDRTGKTYRVHSFTAILERRRNAGFEWVEKGRGVRFLGKEEPDYGTVPLFNTVPASGTVPVPGTDPETGTGSVLNSGTVSVPETGTPLGSIRNIEEFPTSSSTTAVQTVARKYGLVMDDDAARKLVRRCRTACEDLSDEEIAIFTEMKILQLRNSPSVTNWIGMLIASVPAYFEGERNELRKHREQRARELEQGRELARQILADPEASDSDRAWAEEALAAARLIPSNQ